jgi:hypothetical protein
MAPANVAGRRMLAKPAMADTVSPKGSQEIGFQGQNDPRLVESVPRQSDIAEERLLRLAASVIGRGLPLHMAQARHGLAETGEQGLSARRKQRWGDQSDALA